MALTMPAKTWEKGGSGNASTESSTKSVFNFSKDSPFYEASVKIAQEKEAKKSEDEKRAKYEADEKRAKYYADNIKPFTDTYNDIANYSSNYFDSWRSENDSKHMQSLYTSLNEHYTKLRDSVTDNSYLKDVLSEDEYIRLEREVNAIGESIGGALDSIKQTSDVYAQYKDADSYNKHLRLSGMSSDELQEQIDALDKKSDYMSKLDSSYDTIKVMGDDVRTPTQEYKDYLKQAEADRVEFTSYMNNAKYREGVEKYGVDPASMTYDEITKYIGNTYFAQTKPDQYDFVKKYYDSKGDSYWVDKRAEEFVKGLDVNELYWYKKAVETNYGASTDPEAKQNYTRFNELEKIKDKIVEKTGDSPEQVSENIALANRYFHSEDREKSKEAIADAVGNLPILSNVASVGLSAIGSPLAFLDQVAQTVAGKITGDDTPMDLNTAGQTLVNISNDIREETRNEIEKKTSAKLPNGSNLGVFAYDTIMTIADVATGMAIGGVASVGKGLTAKEMAKSVAKVSGFISSSRAAAGEVQEAIANGDSNAVAVAKGAIVGAIEAITERIQIDNLVAGIVKGDTAIKTIIKGALSEGTEEVVSNILAEDVMEAAFGNGTRFKRLYDDYLAQGYKKDRAFEKAILDVVGEDAETFVSAAISGAAFGGITAIDTRANDKANTKMAQNAINNEIAGVGEIKFLREINNMMANAEENLNDASVAEAARLVNDRIEFVDKAKKSIEENGSLKRVIGESGAKAEIEKIDNAENHLKEILGYIRDGSYDASIQDYLITAREEANNASAESTAMKEGKLRAAAEKYVNAVGSVKDAVSALKKTKTNIDTEMTSLKAEKKTILESMRTGTADTKAKSRLREINAAIKNNTRDADRADKLSAEITKGYASYMNRALGNSTKDIGKALSGATGRDVRVEYDATMAENEAASVKTNGKVSTLRLNPVNILRAQAELEDSGANIARSKVVHEAGHIAARTDGTFVPKVYAIYSDLRDNGFIPSDIINEETSRTEYRSTLDAFLKTNGAQAEKNALINENGLTEQEAVKLLEDRYMQEEYVMQFLEYMENNGANLYNTIVPEKRNAFVEAMHKIAQFFRDIAAKIRKTDPASAKKMETLADKLYNAVSSFAEGSTTAQERTNAKTIENTTDTKSAESEGSTGTHTEDERKSLDVRATLKKVFDEVEVVDGIAVSRDVAEIMKSDEYSKPNDYMEFFSFSTTDDWKKNYLAQNKGAGAQGVADAIVRFTEKMVQDDAIRGYVPMGNYKTNKMGPLRTNQEYIWTFDMDTSCPRTFQFLNFRDAIQKKAGRYLTYNESINLLELMRAYGQQIPCCYCYVENKRVLLSASYNNFFNFRNAVLNAATDEEAEKAMYGYDAKKGLPEASRKALARWRSDLSYNPSVTDVWKATNTARNSVLNYLDAEKKAGNITEKTAESKLNKMVLDKFGITDKGAIVEIEGFVKDWAYDVLADIPHIYNTDNDASVSEVDERALSLNHEALAYSKSSSSAKSVENYIPYTDQLKNVSEQDKAYIIGMGGIRKHSSNDFRMDYVQDYFLFYADLAAGKWTGHTYSKSTDFVKIFACTGDRINMSVAFYEDANGNLRENIDEGASFRDVKELRKAYDNVGSMAMVTSDNQLSYALNADWIDMIIPFHASGLDKSVWYNLRMWNDYTTKQSERFYNADTMKQKLTEAGVEIPKGAKAADIKELFEKEFNVKHIYGEKGEVLKPHFFPGDTYVNGQLVPGHHNDVKTYFRLCEEYGVHPRFYGIEVNDANGKNIEITEHPNYLKLIKETSRTDTPQEAIKFNFGNYDDYLGMTPFEYAMQRLQEEAKNGGFANTKADPYGVVNEFTEEYLGKNRPLGYLTDRAKETRDILLEMSKESESKQKAVVEEADERKSIATGTSIYIKDGHTADGQTVDFVNLILDGKKKGETRSHKSLTRKWVGIAKDGYVYGRVRFGEPYLISKDSPEYAESYIEGTEYDIEDGEQKYYYPVLEIEDFRDDPKPITKHGNYAQYEYDDGTTVDDVEDVRYSQGVNFVKDKYFDRQIDRWSDLRDNSYLKVGEIKSNSALHAVGIPAGGLFFDVSKIKKEMVSHGDHLTEETLKGIPTLLNNPITLTEYKPGTNSNTVSVYGNLFANGIPVTVGVVMTRNSGGTVISKIRTVHARSDLKKQITDESVLYIGENKKETNAWYQTCGIDVPLGGTQLGVIRSIDFVDSLTQPKQKVNTSDEDSRSSLVINPKAKSFDNWDIDDDTDVRNREAAYEMALEAGDLSMAEEIVREAARSAGYNSPKLYHGTQKFGFTKPNPRYSDDGISFFATSDLDVAHTYSSANGVRYVSDKSEPRKSLFELENYKAIDEFIKRYDTPKDNDRASKEQIKEFVFNELSSIVDQANIEAENSLGYKDYWDIEDARRVSDRVAVYLTGDDIPDKLGAVMAVQDYLAEINEELEESYAENGGNYQFYGNTYDFLEIDAGGSVWSAIDYTPPEVQKLWDEWETLNSEASEWRDKIRQYAAEHGVSLGEAEDKVRGYWEYVDSVAILEERIEEAQRQSGIPSEASTRDIASWAKKRGYKGVIIKNLFDDGGRGKYGQERPADVYIFFDPSSQVRSADVVTYDDDGNVIPLSERFNPLNDDIRYSIESEQKKIARLKEDKEFLKRQMQSGRSVALSTSGKDSILRDMKKQYGLDKSDMASVKEMLDAIDKIVNGKIKAERMEEVFGQLERDARTILENVYEVDSHLMRENEEFIKYIRSTPLSVPAENESDLAGGYAEYRNENRKYVKLSKDGTPVASVYATICDQYPGMLDRTITSPVEQIEEIVRVMKSLEPEDVPVYADIINQAAGEFVNALVAKYMNTAKKTYAQEMRDKADKAKAEFDSKEKSYKQDIKSAKNELRQTVTAYEARLNSIEHAAARDAKEYERIINRYRDIENAREFAGDRKEYARRIRQDARAIRSAAVSPNQKKFIPEAYRKQVENIALWLDRVSVGGVNLNSDDANWTAIAYIRDDINKVSAMFSEDFLGLANGLLNQIEDVTGEAGRAYNKDLKAAIFYRDAYKLGRLMRKSIANMNKVVINGKNVIAAWVGTDITETLDKRLLTQKQFDSLANAPKSKKIWNTVFNHNLSFTDAYSFFHRMGKAGDNIYETLRDAQSRQYLYIKQYTDKVSDALSDVDLSQYAGEKQKTVSITLTNGNAYTLTAAQAMNIVTLYERSSGKSHIENGGVRIYNPKTRQASTATALTEKDIASLRNALDETDKKVMHVLADFMRDECTAWGNEATMGKYGFHRFTTKDYFPISVDKTAIGADMKSYAPAQFNVENVGFAKTTKDDASAPVMIDSMIDVANNHIRGMASYAAYLNVEDGLNRIMKVPGVADAMKRALGSDAQKYITEMMNDLKGAGKIEELASNTVEILNKFAGRYKAAAVSYNASTVAKQPLSYLRAAAVIDAKYLIEGVAGNHKTAYDEMMKHSGIAVRKEIGYSDVGVGKTIGEQIGYTESGTLKSGVRKFNEFGMAGAALADRVTWESIWLACKAEQLAKNASAAIDRDALMEATAKRFEEVVAQTQVVDSALDSAPVSRSNNPLVRLTYAFMSEPIKGYNLFVNALDDLVNSADENAKKRAAKHLARVSAYTIVGWAAEAAITSAFSAIRDDDDDFFEKFSETYFGNLAQNALGIVPQIDPIVDMFAEVFNGYTPSNMADQTIIDVASNIIDAFKMLKDYEGKRETRPKAIRDAVESVFTMLGVPVKNIARMVNNTAKSAFHITNAYKASYGLQKIWYNPNNATAREKNGFNSILADAYMSGDRDAFEYIYEDMRKMGLKPQQLVNSIAKDSFEDDIADKDKSTLVKYTPGSDAWYIGMKTIFNRDEKAPKATEDEITRVYKETKETSVLPKFKSGEYTVDGKEKEFKGDALDKYLEDYGSLYYEIANAMRDLAAYRKGTAQEQAWWLTKAEKFASASAIYSQDKEYSVTSVGKWAADYIGKKPADVAKYIVANLSK